MGVKDDFSKFWSNYGESLLTVIRDSKCKLNDSKVSKFINYEDIPDEALLEEMLPDSEPSNPTGYKVCVIAHHCLPNHCDFEYPALIHPADPKSCLSTEYISEHECFENEEPFVVNSINIEDYKINIFN